jgi:regulator of vacuolar morphogenesis
MTAIQAVYVCSHEERSDPKPHIVYNIEIQAHVRKWNMWRRYSEFVDLNTELTQSTGSTPPAQLPPKHSLSLLRSRRDAKLLEERRAGLEGYLRAIVSVKDDKWRESLAFREFLGVPIGRQGIGLPSQFTSSSWLDERIELQAHIRDARADINKRDALSDRGDVAASHKASVDAKKKLAGIISRIGTLGQGLQELGLGGMSGGELQRRTDMVAQLQDDCEKLGKMATVARQTSRGLGIGGSGASATRVPAPETDRESLLGGPSLKPFARVFGAAPAKPQETEATRPLDDRGLFQLHEQQMQQQDSELSQLSTILQRQKQLGQAIGNELAIQIEMLDDLDNEVDSVRRKLTNANRQVNKLG